ncbi:MAG: hypothetical protein NXH78_16255 [Hyphomonadaceae bacterium]|nr:hypothetical protein [Hyphomonadaceae bacterium]
MARSLIERLKKRIRDNVLDFLETEPSAESPPLHSIPSSDLIHRLKLRLGAIEAERYRLTQSLGEPADTRLLDTRASKALDDGDDRLAREILRVKLDHATTRAAAAERIEDLDLEAADLQALIKLVADDEEIDESLEVRLAKYESLLDATATKEQKDG